MNKTITRDKSYMSLLENSVNELFSPSSSKSIIDYSQLNLVKVDQLKVIDFEQLKLLDMKEFQLLNLAVLGVFFQYIGAMFLTLSLGFMVAFGTFSLHQSINTAVLARSSEKVVIHRAARVQNLNLAQDRTSNSASRATFAALVDNTAVATATSERPAVLGTSTQPTADIGSCSFRVVEGEKSERFSNGSIYSPSKVFKLCVDSNRKSEGFAWGFDSSISENNSDCVSSFELVGVQNISATLLDEAGNVSASCDISLTKDAVVASNN